MRLWNPDETPFAVAPGHRSSGRRIAVAIGHALLRPGVRLGSPGDGYAPSIASAAWVPRGALGQMRARLQALGYEVEDRTFGPGDLAIYLDDPDGNVVEVTERTTLWGGLPTSEALHEG